MIQIPSAPHTLWSPEYPHNSASEIYTVSELREGTEISVSDIYFKKNESPNTKVPLSLIKN